jgi:AcrR family transcriptional regulator
MRDDDPTVATVVMPPLQQRSRPERADAARNRRILLEAAGRILREDGVAALSMEAVAAAAGVGIGTVYRRFGDLSGLAYALLDQSEQALQADFMFGAPPVGPGAPPADRLHAFLHRCVDHLTEQAEILTMAESGTQHYRTAAYGVRRRHTTMLLHEINPDLDADYLADALLAALSGRLFLHHTVDEHMDTDRIKSGLDQLLRGITD